MLQGWDPPSPSLKGPRNTQREGSMDCKTQAWQSVIQALGSQQEEEPAVKKKMEEMFRAWTTWARKGRSQINV